MGMRVVVYEYGATGMGMYEASGVGMGPRASGMGLVVWVWG